MPIKNTYTVDGCPFQIDNLKGVNVIVDVSTAEIIAEQGKDFSSLSEMYKWVEKLNIAWSDGYKRHKALISKKKEAK